MGGEGPLRFRAERSVLHWAAELPRRLVRPGQLALPLQGIVRVTGVLLGPETVYCQSPRPSPTPAVRASNSFCVQPVLHDFDYSCSLTKACLEELSMDYLRN